MTTTVTTASRTWTVDTAHSNIGFTARHMMISKVRGKFRRVKGELQIPEGTAIPTSIAAEIEGASINTREEQRDAHLRSADFIEAEKFPKLTFKSTSILKVGDAAFDVTGDLMIRGTTKSVTFPVEVEGHGADPQGSQRIGYSASPPKT